MAVIHGLSHTLKTEKFNLLRDRSNSGGDIIYDFVGRDYVTRIVFEDEHSVEVIKLTKNGVIVYKMHFIHAPMEIVIKAVKMAKKA